MRVSSLLNAATALFAASVASQRLTKPPLQQNLDNLKQGFLDNLPAQGASRSGFQAGFIPAGCKNIIQREGYNPADFQVVNVKYNDCNAPWIICYHKNSPVTLDNFIRVFGRVPVHTRQFVRHAVTVPNGGGAYNLGGDLLFYGGSMGNLNVHIHEAAHSLDARAFKDSRLSASQKWLSEYAQDSAVPDPYAQTNQIENVAQNTVITTYQRNVPGGFFGINPNANKIFHQYATVDTEQREAGNLLVKGGSCTSRLTNSEPVPVNGAASRINAAAKPDVALPAELKVIPEIEIDTRESCKAAGLV
ncbi:MAG: hypothetical protein Q9174_007190 [Haloplaca sp. 1 TL-2023]